MPLRKKTIPLSERYNLYLTAQERELSRLEQRTTQSSMGNGRFQAIQNVVAAMQLHMAVDPTIAPETIHKLRSDIEDKMSYLHDNYKMFTPTERDVAQGAYAEYKRQLEQIRNLLTPMKEGK